MKMSQQESRLYSEACKTRPEYNFLLCLFFPPSFLFPVTVKLLEQLLLTTLKYASLSSTIPEFIALKNTPNLSFSTKKDKNLRKKINYLYLLY